MDSYTSIVFQLNITCLYSYTLMRSQCHKPFCQRWRYHSGSAYQSVSSRLIILSLVFNAGMYVYMCYINNKKKLFLLKNVQQKNRGSIFSQFNKKLKRISTRHCSIYCSHSKLFYNYIEYKLDWKHHRYMSFIVMKVVHLICFIHNAMITAISFVVFLKMHSDYNVYNIVTL